MAAEEDVLLREVDEDLQRDQTLQRFREWRVPLAIGAIAIVGGVSGYQFWQGQKASAMDAAAEAYAAISFEAQTPPSADTLRTFAAENEGGYGALSALRAAGELGRAGDLEGAGELYARIYDDSTLSPAMRDFARINAAYLLVSNRPAEAASIVSLIETNAFRPHSEEVISATALAEGSYRAARAGFQALAEAPGTPEGMRARATSYAAIADAALNGASIAKPQAPVDTRSFIDRLGSELGAAGLPVGAPGVEDIMPDLSNLGAAAAPAEEPAPEGEEPSAPEPSNEEPPQE
ncbi:MAG: tetratricopeptide repeat protein [Pseudomonadota bacterium]